MWKHEEDFNIQKLCQLIGVQYKTLGKIKRLSHTKLRRRK